MIRNENLENDSNSVQMFSWEQFKYHGNIQGCQSVISVEFIFFLLGRFRMHHFQNHYRIFLNGNPMTN